MQIVGPAAGGAVQIEFALRDDLPRVRIDAEQLRQVLMNLVHNGLHAMGSRGTLTIGTRLRAGSLRAWRGDESSNELPSLVEISVSDTGQGISPKILNSLFVPFFSTKSTGTGLGLAISQRIVQAAGGAIEVASQEGKGSTFTVLLPAVDEREEADQNIATSDPVAPSQSGATT
jgi:signal transduction histidine kinase